ncbi:MAG: hypothetical protein H6974_04275 [Gammaproteobacteria bacterium]|nr:hypothetical protein [Gammaproteobacteria bacterium]MCP5195998.1 hypothetical protein [Gammaproteobacteria bacterium]
MFRDLAAQIGPIHPAILANGLQQATHYRR